MCKPAARVGDMHVCPMVTPGVPPIPHVGGPLLPPGKPTVLIGGMPAATATNMAVCVGPPDTVVLGSTGVLICSMPAARMGDMCAHGGTIVLGFPTVLIGEVSPCPVVPSMLMALLAALVTFPPIQAAAGCFGGAGAGRPPDTPSLTGAVAGGASGAPQMPSAVPTVSQTTPLTFPDGEAAAFVPWRADLPDGGQVSGVTGRDGMARVGNLGDLGVDSIQPQIDAPEGTAQQIQETRRELEQSAQAIRERVPEPLADAAEEQAGKQAEKAKDHLKKPKWIR